MSDELPERELAALLDDPAVWAEPPEGLEHDVVAAVGAQRRAEVDISRDRSPWPGRLVAAALGAAAAAAIVIAVMPRDTGSTWADEVALEGTALAPDVAGTAQIRSVASGVEILFAAPGLPRRDDGEFYQAWMKNCDGSLLVPLGSFHDLADATGWAGVAVWDYPLLTVTREVAAAPEDPAQGSSGEVVLTGAIADCPE